MNAYIPNTTGQMLIEFSVDADDGQWWLTVTPIVGWLCESDEPTAAHPVTAWEGPILSDLHGLLSPDGNVADREGFTIQPKDEWVKWCIQRTRAKGITCADFWTNGVKP